MGRSFSQQCAGDLSKMDQRDRKVLSQKEVEYLLLISKSGLDGVRRSCGDCVLFGKRDRAALLKATVRLTDGLVYVDLIVHYKNSQVQK